MEAATWILVAIGDAAYLNGDLDRASEAFFYALQGPGGLGNPFIHYRLGQISFDQNNLDKAADELMRAYMGADPEIFGYDDPKYYNFLKTRPDIG